MVLHKDIFQTIAQLNKLNESFAIATVIIVKGSSSGKEGDKAVFDQMGKRILGWVGGGCVENRVGQTVLETLIDNRPRIIDVNLDSDDMELGIPCGGIMTILVEPNKKTPVLLIRGMGRIVETIAEFGHKLNFRILVQTPEDEQSRYENADRIIIDPLDLETMDELIDYFILATHYRDDHEQTLTALNMGIPYVAVVASRKKAGLIMDYLKENDVQEETLQRFHSPAGLDLNAKSAEEIALSILSEIVMLKNSGSGKILGS